jgi:hypothetical protein
MPVLDLRCQTCGWSRDDVYLPLQSSPRLCPQGHECESVWTKPPAVIPDTYANPVVDEHVGLPGSDRSPFTSKWE